ncbi:surfeit locus protein 5 subunit 22 of mediator complex-domain-containing protein [Pyronema omphalodes]|nr:surfeit locus protein 5 subunit 22 of mediator complex-domain-containing protein [Pyronema omphalodes]
MSSDPNAGYRALQARVNTNMSTLLTRFEAIAQLAPVGNKDRTISASETFQIETHASSMIRAAEDLLALTRSMKEAWIFGQLGGGFEGGNPKADEDATIVGEILREKARVIEKGGVEEVGEPMEGVETEAGLKGEGS